MTHTLTALIVDELHNATSVCSAFSRPVDGSKSGPQYMICSTTDRLCVYSTDQEGLLQKQHEIRLFGRAEALVGLPCCDHHAHALVLSSNMQVTLVSLQQAPDASHMELHRLASKQLPAPAEHAATQRIDGACYSRALAAHGHIQVALSTHHDTVHVVRWAAGSTELQAAALDLKQGVLLDLRPGRAGYRSTARGRT